ncbi:transcriptional regulator, GntR family-like protein [Ramlibacter tataouinensis TTB310]|uniref:Transcriptional regulator, GntR family-like protein n=1 Tax=Ramlibacter tataouinensis (strain ATCC BAA-407 / DSM 14655 / LMG 21543 / TTB310) TaxID=365046 RepID=F5Y2H0_RAMTT|nr:transcriptional regulator, GntR family-like protein [Ramlibacter tataouinensis TTB310]
MPHADRAMADAVRRTSLGRLVRDDVLGMILRGEIRAGERINEPDVAQRLGVSRVPVREALRELQSSGLVEARKHAGVFVRRLDAAEVRGLYELRALLDGFAGRRAAQLPAPARTALAARLDASIDAMQAAADRGSVPDYYSENLRFHWLMVEATGNAALSESYRHVVQKLHLSRLTNLSQDLGMPASIAEHRRIAAAQRAGDAALCERLLAGHVRDAHRRLAGDPPNPQETHP